MKYGYIYKITYTDELSHLFNHFYYGQRKYYKNESLLDPTGPYYYHGTSSRANKEYWPYYSSHTKEIICWADNKDELDKLEIDIISNNIENPLCINVRPGGKGGCEKGRIPWNKGLKGVQVSANKGKSAWNKGLKTPNETRIKQSKSAQGHKVSDEQREKQRNSMKEYYKTHDIWNKGLKLK